MSFLTFAKYVRNLGHFYNRFIYQLASLAEMEFQAIANHAQHHIERWGSQIESEIAPFTKAAEVIEILQDTQTSIRKELGAAHAAYPYCTSILGV